MPAQPTHFSVSQVRVAATCPRILYFDADQARRSRSRRPAVTRLWKTGADDQTACGTLFHAAVEKFNDTAARSRVVTDLLLAAEGSAAIEQGLLRYIYHHCVPRQKLYRATGPQQQAFIAALNRYVGELADILAYALAQQMPLGEIVEHLFGDRRRRVDAVFDVGPEGEPVHVSGILDYVFYDWRSGRRRIIDYKLTPGHQPANDLFQVCIYSLMHNVQYGSQTDVGVLYLHPQRRMVEKPWEQIYAQRHTIYDLLASMAAWIRYDPAGGEGLKPPGEPSLCGQCPWNRVCAARLGPKNEGGRLAHWSDAAAGSARVGPKVTRSDSTPGEPQGPSPRSDKRGAEVARTDSSPAEPTSRSAPSSSAPSSLWIGRTTGDQQPVGLPASALATHVSVVGAAGSGKTWAAKVLVEEAILQGIPVLAIDPQGDLVQFIQQQDAAGLTADVAARHHSFCQLVEPRVFTPGTSHGIRISLNPIRLTAPLGGAASLGEPEQRHREEFEAVLAATASNVVNMAAAGGETDSQAAFVLRLLHRLLQEQRPSALQLDDLAGGLADPSGLDIQDADAFIRKAERERLSRKLNALLHGPAAGLFRGGVAVDVDRFRQPTRPGRVPLNVLYLNALVDDRQKHFFVAALAVEIYRWMVTSAEAGSGANLLVYLDEARDFIPAGARNPPAKEPLKRLFAQGRKYGVACLICTQSPRSVDYQVFGNSSTKIVGRLESQQDVQRVAEWFRTESPPAWLAARKGALPGSFVARWPGMPPELEGREFKSRPLFSLHQGAWTPDRVERELRGHPASLLT